MKAREGNKRWRDANPDKLYDAVKRWKAANPDRVKEYDRRTQERKRLAKLVELDPGPNP